MGIGTNIATVRKAKGLTQAELSEKINIHPITLSNWEREKKELKAFQINKLAAALECDPSELLNPTNPSGERTITKKSTVPTK